MVEVSFFCDNLQPFLTAFGWLVGYSLDGDDREAVSNGVRETDAEAGRWYEYEFHGRQPAAFSVALDDPGGSVVRFRVELPPELEPQVRLLADFCSHFHWQTPRA